MLTGRKLAVTIAFAGLLLVAFGAGCQGFFVSPTLTTIAVSPTTVTVAIGSTTSLQVFGTYSDGSRNLVTSGVSWSVDPPGIATVTGGGSGNVTGVSAGSTTATASAQAITGTASINVAGNVNSITVTPTTQSVTVGQTPGVTFTFPASPGPPTFITTGNGGTLTISPADGTINCVISTDASGNPTELCTSSGGGQSPSYTLVMTYVNATGIIITSTPVATLNVSGN
jgi:hypothetical protein